MRYWHKTRALLAPTAVTVGLLSGLTGGAMAQAPVAASPSTRSTSPATATTAGDAQAQARAFHQWYASLCMQHLTQLDALRAKLRAVPELPPEKAAPFLMGKPGHAWPIADKTGHFVLVLLDGAPFCAIAGRRVDVALTRQLFTQLVGKAPAPLVARTHSTGDAPGQRAGASGRQTVSYGWSVPGAQREMAFTLSTTASADAPMQALGTAALVSR